MQDINAGKISELELSAFMTSVFIRGFDIEETVSMTNALLSNGKRIEFAKKPIVDKHCIGGINGRSTLVLVPVIAAAGYCIPKTSSKAITSAAGTADSMECLANASLPLKKLKQVVEKTNACIAWGGALDLAPVDDKIIRINPKKLVTEGIHYHAGFKVYTDGQLEDFSQIKYMSVLACEVDEEIEYEENDQLEKAHLHDEVGEVVHVEAEGAKWKDLFQNINYKFDSKNDPEIYWDINPKIKFSKKSRFYLKYRFNLTGEAHTYEAQYLFGW